MPARPGITITDASARMQAALATFRRGATPEARKAAQLALEAAISDAARLPAASWNDAIAKAEIARACVIGRDARAARQILASLTRDLEHLPPKGKLPCR